MGGTALQFIGSQTLSLSSLGANAELHYLRLIFSQQGLCELRGVFTCSLMDFRYHPTLLSPAHELLAEPRPLDGFLFDDCDVRPAEPRHL